MKSELFDIQNALNECRNSLGNLNISDNFQSKPQFKLNELPDFFGFELPKTAHRSIYKNKSLFYNPNPNYNSGKKDGLFWSSSLESDSFSSTLISNLNDSESYPSTSVCNFTDEDAPFNLKSLQFNRNSMHVPKSMFNFEIQTNSSTSGTTTTDDISARFSTSSKNKMAPLSWRKYTKRYSLYNLRRGKRYSHHNYIRVYNHNSINNFKRSSKKVDSNRNSFQSMSSISDSDDTFEKMLFKYKNHISSPKRSNKKFSTVALPAKNRTSTLKDHFRVINHKNTLNHSVFEPQLTSTPILHKSKASPSSNCINSSYLDGILFNLASSNNQMNKFIAMKLARNDDNLLLSDYFSASTHAENDYDVPDPSLNKNDYQVPIPYLPKKLNGNKSDGKNRLEIQDIDLTKSSQIKSNDVKRPPSRMEIRNIDLTADDNLTQPKENNLNLIDDNNAKNTSTLSNSSTVTAVIKCCVKPFRHLIHHKNVKKCLKKF